jgi:ACS family hexuronate transporter-like MFS transporter
LKRWYFVALVTAAIAISYFDRQTLPVAISAIERTIPLSDQQFSWLQFAFLIPYALLYAAGGRLLDVLGTRRGFILIMLWWSGACALHGLAMNFGFLLGRAACWGWAKAEHFPRRREWWRSGFRLVGDRQRWESSMRGRRWDRCWLRR